MTTMTESTNSNALRLKAPCGAVATDWHESCSWPSSTLWRKVRGFDACRSALRSDFAPPGFER